jgi:multicomponent Na+:H+ antiporter subunit B
VSGLLLGLLLALALALAVAALLARDLLGAVLTLGGYGLVLSLIWAEMGAVDVAFTEAMVGAGISTVFLLAALLRTSATRTAPRRRARRGAVLAAGLLGGVLLWGRGGLPPFGDPGSAPSQHVSPRYLASGRAETGSPNIVTAVLADYRAFDTLIETVVILTAALACWVLLPPRSDE